MKKAKLNGMRDLAKVLNEYSNAGWFVQIVLDRSTGRIFGVPHVRKSRSLWEHEDERDSWNWYDSDCISARMQDINPYDDKRPWEYYDKNLRNARIRAWANKALENF